MMDTKDLLKRISALRQRLDQTRESAGTATATLMQQDAPANDPVQALQHKVESGSWETILLNDSMRPLPEVAAKGGENENLPSLLTSRGVRLLKRGQELLREMRDLAEDPVLPGQSSGAGDEQDPLWLLHRDMAAVTEVVVRTVQVFPSAPSAQIRLCEGLESILAMADEKLNILRSGLNLRRKEQRRIDFLAEVLTNLLNGSPSALMALKPLALELLSEARQGQALRIFAPPPTDAARFVAAHSLNMAQVLSRVLLGDRDWQDRPEEPLLTAFVHDIGMLQVPGEILAHNGPLGDDQRRIVERHPVLGAEVAARLWPDGGPQVEAIADHHERFDGTGYPSGRSEQQLPNFTRLFAVCDVYAALRGQRPYRPAQDSRAAVTDILAMANQGVFDPAQAERLLTLSYHPVGSAVELSDGCFAVVTAVHPAPVGPAHPARPVVMLLTDPHGLPMPIPRQIDLARDEQRSIVRNLPQQDRRRFMLKRFPELAS